MEEESPFEPAAFCQQCGTADAVKRTVPWQPDICATCGADIVVPEE